ncbi:PTS system mannose/fructose/sorbose family transporter subunit IID [Eggerthia catenaformis]|uniref:PTS system mannose/fructose/sorbose family transporter subunit IID n=1 Tax=Eggerthia catenaformis TaxID=31973 RepID=UPI00248E6111|nr:PTS system mannose/fructose/sorbose family transporter subunit IID [Eggerthia catenaformis]
MDNKKRKEEVMTEDVFKKTFWRSFPLQACFNFERMQNIGFAYMMIPALKKLYPNKEDLKIALKRHLTIFNTTPAVVTFIAGATIAMEEKIKNAKEKGEEVDEESINAVKTALMGPLAGIGDSFFWGTFRIIGAGIGASLAAKGSIMGAVLFLLIYNIPHLIVRYQGLKLGYKSGVSFLESLSKGGVIALLTEVAKILGLVVVGSMCGSMVSLSTPLVLKISGAKIVFQEVFDGIIKGLLPLGFTWLLYKLLQKGFKTTTLLWGILVLGIIGAVAGIF